MRLTKGKIKKLLQKKNQTRKNKRPVKRLPLNKTLKPKKKVFDISKKTFKNRQTYGGGFFDSFTNYLLKNKSKPEEHVSNPMRPVNNDPVNNDPVNELKQISVSKPITKLIDDFSLNVIDKNLYTKLLGKDVRSKLLQEINRQSKLILQNKVTTEEITQVINNITHDVISKINTIIDNLSPTTKERETPPQSSTGQITHNDENVSVSNPLHRLNNDVLYKVNKISTTIPNFLDSTNVIGTGELPIAFTNIPSYQQPSITPSAQPSPSTSSPSPSTSSPSSSTSSQSSSTSLNQSTQPSSSTSSPSSSNQSAQPSPSTSAQPSPSTSSQSSSTS